MALTVNDKIDIAKISQYLSNVDTAKSGLFGPRPDQTLPEKLYLERKAVEWEFNGEDLTDGGVTPVLASNSLFATSNYLYSLCGKYSLRAQAILNGSVGGGTVNIGGGGVANIQSPIVITSADFADATNWNGANSAGVVIEPYYTLQVYADSLNQRFLEVNTQWRRTAQGIEILLDEFDAEANEYTFYIYISI